MIFINTITMICMRGGSISALNTNSANSIAASKRTSILSAMMIVPADQDINISSIKTSEQCSEVLRNETAREMREVTGGGGVKKQDYLLQDAIK